MRYSVIYICLLIISCEGPKEEKLNFIFDELSIEMTGNMPVNPGQNQLIESDSGEYLMIYNNFSNSYQFLDFPSGDLIHEIPLEFDGEHSIRGFSGGRILNKDSIWILTNPPAIVLINFKGEVLQRKRITNDLLPITYINAFQHKAPFQNGKRIFGTQPLFMNHHGMGKEDIRKHQLIFSYDFDLDSIQWYDVFYPEEYWDRGKKLSEYSWAERDGKLYIAPWYDHEIQIFDMETGNILNKEQVESEHINHFDYVNELPKSALEGLKNRLVYDRYGSLVYDQYRDVFYRLFLPRIELEENYSVEDIQKLNWSRPYAGIMALDKDLNVLGEHIFERFEVFTEYNYFVGKEGLYLSLNNEFHPDYEEDRFRYMVLKLDTIN